MKPTLFVRLQTDLRQSAASQAAVQEYRAGLHVRWSPDDGPDVDLAEFSRLAGVDVEHYLPELDKNLQDTVTVPVGHGSFFTLDLSVPDCWRELAGRSQDLGLVGEALVGEDFDQSELRAAFNVVHQRAVIAEYLEVAPDWRGGGYGLLALELVLRELGRCADVAALYPMRPGLVDLDEREAAARGLSQYWGRLGFVDFNGVMARDLSELATRAT